MCWVEAFETDEMLDLENKDVEKCENKDAKDEVETGDKEEGGMEI